MGYTLFEYKGNGSKPPFSKWRDGLDGRARGALESRMDILRTKAPEDWPPEMITGTSYGQIKKMRVKQKSDVQLRPRLCFGPVDTSTEVSFLVGVHKKGDREEPDEADKTANARRLEIKDSPVIKRCPYVS